MNIPVRLSLRKAYAALGIAFLAAFFILSATLPAHAGYWVIDHVTVNGHDSYTEENEYSETDDWRHNGDTTDTSFDIEDGMRQVLNFSSAGTFTVYVTWVADGPQIPPLQMLGCNML